MLDELPAELKNDVENALGKSSELRDRLVELKKSNANILQTYPVEQVFVKVDQRSHKLRTGEVLHSPLYRLGVAATLPLFLVVILIQWFPMNKSDKVIDMLPMEQGVRLKGLTPKVVLYRQGVSSLEQVSENTLLKENERLQLAYVAAGYQYGVIFSIDGRGVVTTHFPDYLPSSNLSPSLEDGGETYLSYSYELDDAPIFERFFIVASHQPFDVSLVLDNAVQLAKEPARATSEMLSLPEELVQSTVIVLKHD